MSIRLNDHQDSTGSSLDSVPRRSFAKIKYRFARELGKGQFGTAMLVRGDDGALFVIKRLKAPVSVEPSTTGDLLRRRPTLEDVCDRNALKQSIVEVQALASVRHPFVVRFHEAWVEESDQHLHIAMEYCPGGDLESYLKNHSGKVPEPVICRWMAQALLAMKELHKHRIIHRDIKLPNIFLSGDHSTIKIGDFGLSKLLMRSDDTGATMAGTPYYFSPEMAAGKPHDRKTDIWSLGVVLYFVMEGKLPFRKAKTVVDLLVEIRTQAPARMHDADGYTDDLKGLVHAMLTKSAKSRPTATQLLQLPLLQSALSELLRDEAVDAPQHKQVHATPSKAPAGKVDFAAADVAARQLRSTLDEMRAADGVSHCPPDSSAEQAPGVWKRMKSVRIQKATSGTKHVTHVNLRAAATTNAPVLAQVSLGETIRVQNGTVIASEGATWYHVLFPQSGYCVTTYEGRSLFEDCAAPAADAATAAVDAQAADDDSELRACRLARRLSHQQRAQVAASPRGRLSPVERQQQKRQQQPRDVPRPSPSRTPRPSTPCREGLSPARRESPVVRAAGGPDSKADTEVASTCRRRDSPVKRAAAAAVAADDAQRPAFGARNNNPQSPIRRGGAVSPLAATPRWRG
jgi:NIMA (never in mitosis gene a)-related kinase